MNMASLSFFGFFAAVLAAVFLLRTQSHKKLALLAASYVFYGYWDARFLLVIVVHTLLDFWFGKRLGESSTPQGKKRFLYASLAMNLGTLGFFKYCNFFIESANAAFGSFGFHAGTLDIILPLGISFYTFQSMTYVIDIYRGKLKPAESFFDFALFVTFFPQALCGPITRALEFLPQLKKDIEIKLGNLMAGGQLFLLGFVKKILIADNLGYYVDFVYGNPGAFNSLTLWLATATFSVQILTDFSGYTDMARGAARCLGFELPVNFKVPYLARNVSDFWRRWHMTLSRWLRDYLYIPLGGNRHGRWQTYRNILITMTLGGLWHGASWNFVVWGAVHGAALVAHKIFASQYVFGHDAVSRLAAWFLTFVFVTLSWVFFRTETLIEAAEIFKLLFNPLHQGVAYYYEPFLYVILPLVIGAHLIGGRLRGAEEPVFFRLNFSSVFVIAFALFSVILFSPLQAAPFIYFRF